MSETLNLQPVISKLSDSTEKQQEQALRKELLDFQQSIKTAEEEEKLKIMDEVKSRLEQFELSLSADKPISTELQASIDRLQTEIQTIEAQQKALEDATINDTKNKTKWLWDIITNSNNPEQEFTSRRKWWGSKILWFLGIGTALTTVAAKASGDETWESTKTAKGFFTKAKEWVMDLFGLGDKETTTPPDTETDTDSSEDATTESENHLNLVEKVKRTNIDFKDPDENPSNGIETKDRLPLLSYKTLQILQGVGEKFPWVRITSTLRSENENKALVESYDDSRHMYGLAFDIGRDLRTPAQYTFENVESFIKATYPESMTRIHGKGDNNHLHVETTESSDGRQKYVTKQDIKAVLDAQIAA